MQGAHNVELDKQWHNDSRARGETMRSINKSSSDWLIVKEWAAAELEKHRAALEVPETNLPLTEAHRATIKILNELLALPDSETPAPLPHRETGYGMATDIG